MAAEAYLAADALVVAGLGLIVFACLSFSDATPFPGLLTALVPCIGAALVIQGAGPSLLGGLLLGNAPAVWLGRVSYSLYLVHWPLIVFATAYLARGPEGFERWLLSIGLSVTLRRRAVRIHREALPLRDPWPVDAISPRRGSGFDRNGAGLRQRTA